MGKYRFQGGLTRLWWVPLITGIISIAIGIWCLCSPVISLSVLAYVFAGCMCGAGILNISFGIINSAPHSNWGWSLALGIMEILLGIWLFTLPESMLVTTFIFAVGIYLIVIAINAICESCMLASYAGDWMGWILLLLLATLVFAAIFLSGPVAGGIAVWLYIGLSFITFGIYRLILSAKIRRINTKIRY